jgi:ribonuclease HII
MLKKYLNKSLIEAGCDEAGRGCLAGPVVAAAVILPKNYRHKVLNDSKQLSEKKRDLVRVDILKDALAWAVGVCSPEEIDGINILNASFLAMQKAVLKLDQKPEHLLIDGNRFNKLEGYDHTCIIKGDARFMSIAAASVLAKTYRDELMQGLDLEHPHYNWKQNKGYPTKEHRKAIMIYGATDYHRKSFTLLPVENELESY